MSEMSNREILLNAQVNLQNAKRYSDMSAPMIDVALRQIETVIKRIEAERDED